MPLIQEEGIKDTKERLLQELNDFDPEYARGMIQAIVDTFEENGVNMTPILQDTLADLLQRE